MQTYTLRKVIQAALMNLGVTASNQSTDGQDVFFGLYKAQTLLDSWNLDGGLIFAQTYTVFPILTSKQTYTIGPQLDNPGAILSFDFTQLQGGTGYAPGFTANVSLTGGTGSGATATIVVEADGSVVDVQLAKAGTLYVNGDTLSATLPNGSGFQIPVANTTEQTDFVVEARPQNILAAAFQPTSTAPAIDIPVREFTSIEWAGIVSKNVGSGVPAILYYNKTWPQGECKLWNFPNQGGALVLTYWQYLPAFSLTLDSVIQNSLPQGFTRLLELEVAVALAPAFEREEKIPALTGACEVIKRQMLINNIESMFAKYDVPGPGVYDAMSGTSWR